MRAQRGTCLQRRRGLSLPGNSGAALNHRAWRAGEAYAPVCPVSDNPPCRPRGRSFPIERPRGGGLGCAGGRARVSLGALRRSVHGLAFAPACVLLTPLGGAAAPLSVARSGPGVVSVWWSLVGHLGAPTPSSWLRVTGLRPFLRRRPRSAAVLVLTLQGPCLYPPWAH